MELRTNFHALPLHLQLNLFDAYSVGGLGFFGVFFPLLFLYVSSQRTSAEDWNIQSKLIWPNKSLSMW